MRYFDANVWGAIEFVSLIMVGLCGIGQAWTQSQRGHVVIDTFFSRMSPKKKGIIDSFQLLIGIFFSTVMAWQFIVKAYFYTMEQEFHFGIVKIYWYPWYWAAAVGFSFFAIVMLAHFARSIKVNIDNFKKLGTVD